MVAAAVATLAIAGPVVTVLFGLGGITAIATYMDLRGFTTAMRLAVVGAVAVVVVPLGCWLGGVALDRIEAKKAKAQIAALRYGAHSVNPRGKK